MGAKSRWLYICDAEETLTLCADDPSALSGAHSNWTLSTVARQLRLYEIGPPPVTQNTEHCRHGNDSQSNDSLRLMVAGTVQLVLYSHSATQDSKGLSVVFRFQCRTL